jgi:hypothetical protein
MKNSINLHPQMPCRFRVEPTSSRLKLEYIAEKLKPDLRATVKSQMLGNLRYRTSTSWQGKDSLGDLGSGLPPRE